MGGGTGSLRRVGHKGADALAPGNTVASFEAARHAGVDAIEFDVLSARRDGGGELLIAHDYRDAASRRPPTLDEGLELLSGDPYDGIGFDLDLKLPGYELRVARALYRHGLADRALVSSMEPSSLRLLRARHPQLRLAWTLPLSTAAPWGVRAARAVRDCAGARRALPDRAGAAIRRGEVDAIRIHHLLVTRRLVEAVTAAGGELYAWTVDDPARAAQLARLGVTGVITNDPRLAVAA